MDLQYYLYIMVEEEDKTGVEKSLNTSINDEESGLWINTFYLRKQMVS